MAALQYRPNRAARVLAVDRHGFSATVQQALDVLQRLTSDAYAEYVAAFYRTGLERHGSRWRYADINTALLVLAAGLRPQSYLEIGVRRGRSLAMVASVCPACDIVACDMFIQGTRGHVTMYRDIHWKERPCATATPIQ